MSKDLTRGGGCRMDAQSTVSKARPAVTIELIATIALALSTLVAATAVSIGIARASVPSPAADSDTATIAIAVLIGLLLTGMGGVTAVMTRGGSPRD
jgi:hypothetical protein